MVREKRVLVLISGAGGDGGFTGMHGRCGCGLPIMMLRWEMGRVAEEEVVG